MATDEQPLTRTLLRDLAEERLGEAETLLKAGRVAGAYYLAGYSAELGLKACIARQFRADAIPDRKLVEQTYSHDIAKLASLAGLAESLKRRQLSNKRFAAYWEVVTNWSERARYRRIEAIEASDLLLALTDPQDGVMRWIRENW